MPKHISCDLSKEMHEDEAILGQCLDCGEAACAACGIEEGGIVRHRSPEFCFESGRKMLGRTKFKKLPGQSDETE